MERERIGALNAARAALARQPGSAGSVGTQQAMRTVSGAPSDRTGYGIWGYSTWGNATWGPGHSKAIWGSSHWGLCWWTVRPLNNYPDGKWGLTWWACGRWAQ
jgi:hypothetical protein